VEFKEIKWESLEGVVVGQVVGCCERGNEPSGCVKCVEFLD
jgi:hypothetical protein